MKAALIELLMHAKTAVAYLVAAVLFAVGAGLQAHHVDWWTVGSVGCTALALVCHSIIPASWLAKVKESDEVSKT